ncbi:hypothetical protein [Prosthecobacter sp.]|uniref:hypothetical protein n=1 Tax=Prosthecobacter sp. TaxID=1965333 RepID=UPI003784C15C
MNTTDTAALPPTGTKIELLQCCKQRCGHVMVESEREWIPRHLGSPVKTAVCPKCGGDSFYTLNAQGQCRTTKDRDTPREINAEDINPSPRMGLKMRRRLFAAKNRALGIPSRSELLS